MITNFVLTSHLFDNTKVPAGGNWLDEFLILHPQIMKENIRIEMTHELRN
jgi:hypothetical protein